MIFGVDPVWLAFSIGIFLGSVMMLALICLVYICSGNDECRGCPLLADDSEV